VGGGRVGREAPPGKPVLTRQKEESSGLVRVGDLEEKKNLLHARGLTNAL